MGSSPKSSIHRLEKYKAWQLHTGTRKSVLTLSDHVRPYPWCWDGMPQSLKDKLSTASKHGHSAGGRDREGLLVTQWLQFTLATVQRDEVLLVEDV